MKSLSNVLKHDSQIQVLRSQAYWLPFTLFDLGISDLPINSCIILVNDIQGWNWD